MTLRNNWSLKLQRSEHHYRYNAVLNTGKPALNEYEMRQIAEQLSDELETISEVALVDKRTHRDRNQDRIDPAKLLRYNISVDELALKLSSNNLNFPGGTITEGGKEYVIRTVRTTSASELKQSICDNDLDNRVLLRDVATVRMTLKTW